MQYHRIDTNTYLLVLEITLSGGKVDGWSFKDLSMYLIDMNKDPQARCISKLAIDH